MGYIDHNLITNEEVTHKTKLLSLFFFKPLLLALAFGAVGGSLFYFQQPLPAAVLIVVAAIPIIVASVGRSSAEFAVTNKRVILKMGFVQKKTAEMFLNKIESVGVDQSIVGRMLGYGTIVIRGTGWTLEPFDRISAPLEFRRQMQEQI